MTKKFKLAFGLDIAAVALCFAAIIYWIIYALAIMPPIAINNIQQNADQSAGAQAGAAFGGAIGVAVLIVINIVAIAFCFVVTVVNLILVLRGRKLVLQENTSVSLKKYKSLNIAFYVMLVVVFVLDIIFLAIAVSALYLPAFLLVAVAVVLCCVSLFAKRTALRQCNVSDCQTTLQQ